MRWRALLLTLALLALPARRAVADCAFGDTLTAWPPAGALPTNGQITLSGTTGAFARLPRELALVAADHAIPLRIVETLHGAVGDGQQVLAPTRPLRPATHYRLVIDARQTFAWDTTTRDEIAPQWEEAPIMGTGESHAFGCGPAIYRQVAVAVTDAGAVRILAVVTTPGGKPVGRFRLAITDGTVTVGRHMCGGAFDLRLNQSYRVQLSAVDAAGNRTAAPGGVLTFTPPAEGAVDLPSRRPPPPAAPAPAPPATAVPPPPAPPPTAPRSTRGPAPRPQEPTWRATAVWYGTGLVGLGVVLGLVGLLRRARRSRKRVGG